LLTELVKNLPIDSGGIWKLTFVFLVSYFLISLIAHSIQKSGKGIFEQTTTAASFANSVILLLSTLSDDMLKAITTIKINLAVAALASFGFALKALKKS